MKTHYFLTGLTLLILVAQQSLWSQEAGYDTLVIAHQVDYRPYCHLDDAGNSDGFLIDWWNLWASKAGVDVRFRSGTLQQCIEWVSSGEADAIAGVFGDSGLLDTLQYGDLILRVKTTLFVREDLSPKTIYEVDDTIGLLQSGASFKFVTERYPELSYKYFPTSRSIIDALPSRTLGGFFYERPSPIAGNNNTPQELALEGYVHYLDVRDGALRPAYKTGNTQLGQLLQEASARITTEEVLIVAEKYKFIPEIVPTKDRVQLIARTVMVGVVLLGLLIFILWRQELRRRRLGTTVKDWGRIISKGESDRIEFKSSLRWDYREQKANKALEYVIIKTISAFLNTEGGMLFIGVDDDGEILGLENDYSALHKGNADGFLLTITNLINKHFGKNAHRLVHANIVTINDRDVCIVEIAKSSDPVFLKKGEKEEFFIRASAASVPLGLQESAKYIRKHF